MKVEKMTKVRLPSAHNKSGYVIRYFCPRCAGDMEKCGYAPAMGEQWKGDYQCVTCGYEENIAHYKKRR